MQIFFFIVPCLNSLSSSEQPFFFHKIVNLRAFRPYIDSNATEMFKAKKGSKDIVKISGSTVIL